MSRLRKIILALTLGLSIPVLNTSASTNTYVIDTKGSRTFINFKVSHLGLCLAHGNFTDFSGSFQFDAKSQENSNIHVKIDTRSINSNHFLQGNYLKGARFLNVSQYPDALFVSTKVESSTTDTAKVYGEFSMKGITKNIIIDTEKIGESSDYRGGNRAVFSGTTTLSMADFNLMNLGPVSDNIHITLQVEGVHK